MIDATAIGDGETQRRSYPGVRGPVRHPWLGARARAATCSATPRGSPTRPRRCCSAPQCPEATTTLILGSEQMALQIHESVGHAIELDRILGWEAAFAGTSWLDPAQLGSLRYGSDLMNITADATLPGALGQLRLRRRGRAGPGRRHRPGRHLGRRALRARLGAARRPALRRHGARRRRRPAPDGAHDQRRAAPRRQLASTR